MRKLPSVAALALIGLLLTGCVPGDAGPTPTPVPSSTPVFASDEEALAAAEAAYAAYQAEVDRALATYETGGLASVASGDALATAEESASNYQAAGKKLTGTSEIDSLSLTQGGVASASGDLIQIYACLDISKTDVVDASGSSVVVEGRQLRYPVVVDLRIGPDNRLLVDSEQVWDGDDFCQ